MKFRKIFSLASIRPCVEDSCVRPSMEINFRLVDSLLLTRVSFYLPCHRVDDVCLPCASWHDKIRAALFVPIDVVRMARNSKTIALVLISPRQLFYRLLGSTAFKAVFILVFIICTCVK